MYTRTNLTKLVTDRINDAKAGTVFFPGDLIELGKPETIHTIFSRLAESKQLMRLAKGIYLKPRIDPRLGPLKPSLVELARIIAERDKVIIRPTGAYALFQLGFTLFAPSRVVFLTNGNPKRIKVGKSTIVFQKANPKQFAIKQEKIFLAVQGLIALKEEADSLATVWALDSFLATQQPSDIREGAKLAPQRIARILYEIAYFMERSRGG